MLKKVVIMFMALFCSLTLAACGGGGGGSDYASGDTQTISFYGTIGNQAAPSLEAHRAAGFNAEKHTLDVYDEVNGAPINAARAQLTSTNSFAVETPIETSEKYAVIRLKDKSSGKIIYKNFMGRLPLKNETNANLKITGVELNESTTAKALLLTDNKSKISSAPITLKNIDASSEKTDFEIFMAERISNLDARIAELNKLLEILSGALSNDKISTELKAKIDFSTIQQVVSNYKQITEDLTCAVELKQNGIDVKIKITSENEFVASLKPLYVEAVSKPTIKLASGEYASSQTIEISCLTAGATIKYTLDGSSPIDGGLDYTSPIILKSSSTFIIRAIAIKAGMPKSDIAMAKYIIKIKPAVETELSIISANASIDASGNLSVSWKTNKIAPVKAKITLWTSFVPSANDYSQTEASNSSSTDHSAIINAANIAAGYTKIRIAYSISDESGTYRDIAKNEVTTTTNSDELYIVSANAAKQASGDYLITWDTNKTAAIKAKITIWTSSVPSTSDFSIIEATLPSSTSHSVIVKSANIPSTGFTKIRLSYTFDEETGTFKDILKSEIK